VALANATFSQWETFMQLRRDLADGRFANLAADAEKYRQKQMALGEQYAPNLCFTLSATFKPVPLGIRYFDAFYKLTYDDASRVANNFTIITPKPLRQWKFHVDKEKAGEAAGWQKADFNDGEWKTTDVAQETWSTIGFHNYQGAMWYRTKVTLPTIPPGKKCYLWIGATDGKVKVFVNGQHLPWLNDKQEAVEVFGGYCQPASFNITPAVKPSGENSIALFCTRDFVNELGTGGLIAPVTIYVEK
jgi:hypothetical protein